MEGETTRIALDYRSPVARMAVIAARLRRGLKVNCAHMAARQGVNPKTIARDIEYLRDRMGYKLTWDHRLKSYKLIQAPPPVL